MNYIKHKIRRISVSISVADWWYAYTKNETKPNSEACMGTYVKGSCYSVGVGKNDEQAAGPY
jgi:hypothetical protein